MSLFARWELTVVMKVEMAFSQYVKYFSVALTGTWYCELGVRACLVGIVNVIRMDMIRMIMIIRKTAFLKCFSKILKAVLRKDRLQASYDFRYTQR